MALEITAQTRTALPVTHVISRMEPTLRWESSAGQATLLSISKR